MRPTRWTWVTDVTIAKACVPRKRRPKYSPGLCPVKTRHSIMTSTNTSIQANMVRRTKKDDLMRASITSARAPPGDGTTKPGRRAPKRGNRGPKTPCYHGDRENDRRGAADCPDYRIRPPYPR